MSLTPLVDVEAVLARSETLDVDVDAHFVTFSLLHHNEAFNARAAIRAHLTNREVSLAFCHIFYN